ncbi:MAG: hypothetical protein OHK0023_25940 [Anaerolineae bacterium]
MDDEALVLVGVINRRKDFYLLESAGFYRIPVARAPREIEVPYLAFFLSRQFADLNGTIAYYARCGGHELVRRCDVLPDEAAHPRANDLYFRMAVQTLIPLHPPIRNPNKRPFAFLSTTLGRLKGARTLADLTH